MKITKAQLKQIIKEELSRVLLESSLSPIRDIPSSRRALAAQKESSKATEEAVRIASALLNSGNDEVLVQVVNIMRQGLRGVELLEALQEIQAGL